jgi:hypothetical protein
MRMSPIDQPLMLMELLGRHSPAPVQDIARRILGEDVTQIETTTERVKRMVGRVLTGNGITRYDDFRNLQALCIANAYTVSEGRSLVIPRRHVAEGLELIQSE